MKAVYLDCFSGISGNMLLGAFLQAGVPEAYLRNELNKLPIADEFRLMVREVKKNGILALYADVELVAQASPHGHHHASSPEGVHAHGHTHDHRSMADIRQILEESSLGLEVKKKALLIFEGLAEAEGKVHGLPKEEVHFHEVGAVDSIVDIAGIAICLDYLEIDRVFTSALNTGSGFVQCQHGSMPVPAPATAELLKNIPFYHKGAERELTTPTGAAVVHALADYTETLPAAFETEKIAYGAGTWDLDIPNVLRLYLGDYMGDGRKRLYLLQANIDDMNPQIYGYLYERILEAGAVDVWTTAIFMKKNRPAQQLSVLTDASHKEDCYEVIFTETSTIGVREIPIEQRREATRRMARVQTMYGEVSCKISAYKGKIVSISAEYEDCRRLAAEQHVPLKKIQQEALEELKCRLGE